MTTINITSSHGYDVVQLDHGKVNSINLEMVEELLQYFSQVEDDASVRGVILTGRTNCFSAGLDVGSVFGSGPEDQRKFMIAFHSALQAMINLSKPFICAITGYAPAGACLLACTADYRIMAIGEKHKIGMHEVRLNLQIAEMLLRIYAYWIGKQQALDFVMNSRLLSAEEAANAGLVNEACAVDEVLPRAEATMRRWLESHDKILQRTKQMLRADLRQLVDLDLADTLAMAEADARDESLVARQREFIESFVNRP